MYSWHEYRVSGIIQIHLLKGGPEPPQYFSLYLNLLLQTGLVLGKCQQKELTVWFLMWYENIVWTSHSLTSSKWIIREHHTGCGWTSVIVLFGPVLFFCCVNSRGYQSVNRHWYLPVEDQLINIREFKQVSSRSAGQEKHQLVFSQQIYSDSGQHRKWKCFVLGRMISEAFTCILSIINVQHEGLTEMEVN